MRILIISDEEWNDVVYGNNVLTNWFEHFDADFAQIYASPGLPNNNICFKYFQITDSQMVKSIIGIKKAGHILTNIHNIKKLENANINAQRKGIYSVFKYLSLYMHTVIMFIRDFIWRFGKYDEKELKRFIQDFNPDIVFCPRLLTPKLMRLEDIVSKYTRAPFIAFTADDEASLNQINYSPLFWIRRLMIHYSFRKHIKLYKHYLMFSEDQAADYANRYHISTSLLLKCGNFSPYFEEKEVGKPITMVYAGRLYCNRWKTLVAIGKALKKVNCSEEKIRLFVYSTDELTKEQRTLLSPENHIYMKGRVSPDLLPSIYRNADIALHVESFDKKYASITRFSFSTKIIDLMNSTCAIIAICNENQAGFKYLKNKDAAICISSEDDILNKIKMIVLDSTLIKVYAYKAWKCGIENHQRDIIQQKIRSIFDYYKEKNEIFAKK